MKESETMTRSEFKKIIANAIKAEVAANKFYSGVAKKAKDANLRKLFQELAGEEAQHKLTLKGYMTKGAAELQFSESADYRVADELPTPPLTPDTKPVDGLVIAIKNELAAMQMYTQLAKASADKAQKKVFLELASMERGHKKRLEDIYTNMAFPEAW